MANNRFWLNRIGKFAPTSNPYSNVPNYGLTFDVATAPWDDETQFDSLVAEQVASQLINGLVGLGRNVAKPVQFVPSRGDDANLADRAWAGAKAAVETAGDAAGWVGTGAVGAVDWFADKVGADATLTGNYDKLEKEADKRGLTGWERLQFIGKADLGKAGQNLAQDKIASKAFWALDKVSEGVATTFVAGTESGNNPFRMFDGDTWADAHGLVKQYDLNAGEGFMSMLYDQEFLHDEERVAEVRKNSGVFNFGALAFNVVGAWKFDPAVLVAKGATRARDMRKGQIGTGAAGAVHREVLAQPTREAAEQAARSQQGMSGRVHGAYALTLWDKAQKLRETARSVSDPNVEFGFEDFTRLGPFAQAAGGPVLAKLLVDASTDDKKWDLTFRAAIGDPMARQELLELGPEVADKLNAMELGEMPRLQAEYDAINKKYETRLMEQGGKPDLGDQLILTSPRDWFLDLERTEAAERLWMAKAELGEYRDYENWWTRATQGMTDEALGGGDKSRDINVIFNQLDTLNPKKGMRELAADRNSRALYAARSYVTSTFKVDEYGKVARVVSAPRKPFLKLAGVASLHNVQEGTVAVTSQLDAISYFKGANDPALRDHVLQRFTGATSEVERKAVAEELDRQGIDTVLNKHGVRNPELRKKLIVKLQEKRSLGWQRLGDESMYTTVRDPKGRRLDKRFFEHEDDQGTPTSIAMPIDPSDLPNWFPFTNLMELDKQVALNKDILLELDKEASLVKRGVIKGGHKAARALERLYVDGGEGFNTLWKPIALLSLRWPARVVLDEGFRTLHVIGAAAMFASWGEGVANVAYNGLVKPKEFVNGRIIRRNTLAEDATRAPSGTFDPFDYRAGLNPQAAVPAGALDFENFDDARHTELVKATAERRAWVRKGQMGVKPKWAQKFDDRIAAAEKSTSRGFFFDPVTGNAKNKGYAVSVYPGRLRSFEKRPSSAELHWFLEKNEDILSSKNNQVATWLDKDTGRWHLDVVRVSRRREDAMTLAAHADATEFFDIEDGFTRYMRDEDPFEHAAFAAKGSENPDVPQAAELPDNRNNKPGKRKIGFGAKRWRSLDGRVVEGEGVYGMSPDDANVYFDMHSAKGFAHRLYSGNTKGLAKLRTERGSAHAITYHPDKDTPGAAANKQWAQAQSEYVNHHLRKSPLALRMLNGESDSEIVDWLTRTAQGRQLRNRFPLRGQSPRKWVDDVRYIVEAHLPTRDAKTAAAARDIEPDEWDGLVPLDVRHEVHGDDVLMALGTHKVQSTARSIADSVMSFLAGAPTTTLVRHPFANALYQTHMRNYLASVPSGMIDDGLVQTAAASARAFATKQVKRTLYNIADENQFAHMLRFVAPFIQAQLEVIERYAHLWTTKPESLVRTMQFYYLSQNPHEDRGVWHTENADGDPARGLDHDNKVVLHDNALTRAFKKWMPGLDEAGPLEIPVSSIDLIFQGEKPYLPSMGPLVTVPANEFYFKDRPELSTSKVFEWLYPFGTPKGTNPVARAFQATAPAWAKRVATAYLGQDTDSAFITFSQSRFAGKVYEYQQANGGKYPPKRVEARFVKESIDETHHYWLVRAASSFVSPFPIEAQSPYQFYIDEARKYRNKYGVGWEEKYYDDFGAEFFIFATSTSKSTNGLTPTIEGVKGYKKYKKYIDVAPDLAGVLAGPMPPDGGEYTYEVYNWQTRQPKEPGSKTRMREFPDLTTKVAETQISAGWVEYGKLAAVVDAELRSRGLKSLNSSAAADLARWKAEGIEIIKQRNPAWQGALNSRQDRLSSWLRQANAVVFEPAFDGRPDIEGLRDYMLSRERMQDILWERYRAGGSKSLGTYDETTGTYSGENPDLSAAWDAYTRELKSKNPLFAEIYNRFLEADDLTVTVVE